MPDQNQIIERLIAQATGQGGDSFVAGRAGDGVPSAIRTDQALITQAQRAGQTVDQYWGSLHPDAQRQNQQRAERNVMEQAGVGQPTQVAERPAEAPLPTQADLDQRYRDSQGQTLQGSPRQPQSPVPGMNPNVVRAGLDGAPDRRTPELGEPGAGEPYDANVAARAAGNDPRAPTPPQERRGLPPNPMDFLRGDRTMDIVDDPRAPRREQQPPAAPRRGPNGELIYDNLPLGGEEMGDDEQFRMMSAIAAQERAMAANPQGGPPPVPAVPTQGTPAGQPGVPSAGLPPMPAGDGSGGGGEGGNNLGLPPDPRAPEAFDPETGTRDETTRGVGVMERIFGEEGSDRRDSTGKALMLAGAVMMQTDGNLGEALGAGIQQGLLTYDAAMQAIRDEEKEMRIMGMEDEAHELDMELKRLQIQRARQAGRGGGGRGGRGGGGDGGTDLGEVGTIMARVAGLEDLGIDPTYALDSVMGDMGLYPRGPAAREPEAGLGDLPF